MRQRFCNNPAPVGTGQFCTEPLIEEQVCNNVACTPGSYIQLGTGTAIMNIMGGVAQNASCASLRGYFDCENGVECVPLAYKCDCVAQCSDGSDEADLWAGCIMSAADCVSKAVETTSLSLSILITMAAAVSVLRVMYG